MLHSLSCECNVDLLNFSKELFYSMMSYQIYALWSNVLFHQWHCLTNAFDGVGHLSVTIFPLTFELLI